MEFLSTGTTTLDDIGSSCKLWDLLLMLRVDVVRWEEILVEKQRRNDAATAPDPRETRTPPRSRQLHQQQG